MVSIALLLGIGGAVGAVAAVVSAGSQIAQDWAAFQLAYREYKAARSPDTEAALDSACVELEAELGRFGTAFANLKRAMSRRR